LTTADRHSIIKPVVKRDGPLLLIALRTSRIKGEKS
jgi:hypothetical protein